MTPEQKIKWLALLIDASHTEYTLPSVTNENIDELYDTLVESGHHYDALYDIRDGQVETGIQCQYSRHYESKSVASQLPDGSWVGWTYWYGGGKHGEPEAIDWIVDAYNLDCVEEEKVVIVRTFNKVK